MLSHSEIVQRLLNDELRRARDGESHPVAEREAAIDELLRTAEENIREELTSSRRRDVLHPRSEVRVIHSTHILDVDGGDAERVTATATFTLRAITVEGRVADRIASRRETGRLTISLQSRMLHQSDSGAIVVSDPVRIADRYIDRDITSDAVLGVVEAEEEVEEYRGPSPSLMR